jgi:hypothetical protein
MRPKSSIPGKIPEAAFEYLGDPRECFKGNFLFGTFNVANVISSQIGFFGQFLLTQAKFFPSGADGFSHNAINSA